MRLILASLWILAGAALTAGAYWSFLITPESTIWSLLVSAILALVALALVGWTMNGAILVGWQGASIAAVQRAWRSIPAVIPAALLVALVWWMTGRAEMWVALRSGQISAWFIANFGWSDISWVFTAVNYVAAWFRWVIAALLAVSLMAVVVSRGWRALARPAWLRQALGPRTVIVATVWFVVLIALPWLYLVPWRPQNLPPTSLEFAFIVAKLSVAAVLFAVGAALMIFEASKAPAYRT
jgi:hypothetical protein